MMLRTLAALATVAGLWTALGCSTRAADDPDASAGPAKPLQPAAPVAAAATGDWGTVTGQVTFGGEVAPTRKEITPSQDKAHCESKGKLLEEEWVVNPKNKGVRYAFVWLAPLTTGAKMPIHPDLAGKLPPVEMDQPCCQFVPHAMGVQEGQVWIAKNSSPVPHNTNYAGSPLKNPGNNVLLPPKGALAVNNLKADTFPVKVSCNIHPWMSAWVRVFDHPYFAVTDADGKFELKKAPAGKYRLVGWHEGVGWLDGGKKGQEITIKADGTVEVPLVAKP